MIPSEQTLELNQIQLKRKESLRFSFRSGREADWYLVEDESTGKFFQIGLPQYTFLSLLDGQRTVGEALTQTSSLLREHALSEQDVASFSKWAIDSGLVETQLSNSSFHRNQQAKDDFFKKSMTWMNPVMLKIPLWKPDEWLTRIAPMFGWLISPFFAFVWIVIVVIGFGQLILHWDQFITHRISSFGSNDLVWFGIAWLGLKIVHEFAHAITCKNFGGKVQSSGVLLLLFIPLPFVDVTSSWRFSNRWHRILTSAAGILSEIFIAAIAGWAWVYTDPGPLQFHLGNLIIAATLHTLLFNANPLMRFDAYYIMVDLVSIPNLYTHARSYVKSFFSWVYFGKKMKPIGEAGLRGLFVKTYGFATLAWFGLISISIMLGALALFEGVGVLFAAAGCGVMIGLPIFKLCKFVLFGTETESPNRKWFAIATTATVALLCGILFFCPAPTNIKAPIVIDYLPRTTVRGKVDGFLDEIHVQQGQFVTAGTELARLRNPELESELESIEIDLRISEIKINSFLTKGEIASLKIERDSVAALIEKKRSLQNQVNDLSIGATSDGFVLTKDLQQQRGRYLRSGEEFCELGQSEQLGAQALIRQDDAKWLANPELPDVELIIWGLSGSQQSTAVIKKVYPRATKELPHPAFAASNGGTLAVVSKSEVESTANSADNEMILTKPRVQVDLSLNHDGLLSGQTGLMFLSVRKQNLGSFLASAVQQFLNRNIVRTHGL